MISCGPKSKKKDDVPEVVGQTAPRNGSVSLAETVIPDGLGGTMRITKDNFVGSELRGDILVVNPPASFVLEAEEAAAQRTGLFAVTPGLVFQITPAQAVVISVKNETTGQTQTHQASPSADGRLAVSMNRFTEVFPPSFRTRYTISVKSLLTGPGSFQSTYSIVFRKAELQPVFSVIKPIAKTSTLRLGNDTTTEVFSVTPSAKCNSCSIDIQNLTAELSIKTVIETPVVPVPGKSRVSMPARFAGLVVSIKNSTIDQPTISERDGAKVVSISFPGSLTLTEPWCKASSCRIPYRGKQEETYFRYLNVVPTIMADQLLGGLAGTQYAVGVVKARVVALRDGTPIETKDVTLDTGQISPLDDPSLPNWAKEDFRTAILSGAPEYNR